MSRLTRSPVENLNVSTARYSSFQILADSFPQIIIFFIRSGKTHFGQSDSRPLPLSQAYPPRSDTLLVSFRVVVVVVIHYLEGGMWSLAASKSADFQRQEWKKTLRTKTRLLELLCAQRAAAEIYNDKGGIRLIILVTFAHPFVALLLRF